MGAKPSNGVASSVETTKPVANRPLCQMAAVLDGSVSTSRAFSKTDHTRASTRLRNRARVPSTATTIAGMITTIIVRGSQGADGQEPA